MEFTAEQEIQQIEMGKPHIVIIGAGGSRAALPSGDANGRQLPLMNDLLKVVPGVREALARYGIRNTKRNFEEIYSSLVEIKALEAKSDVEAAIFEYFSSLALPNQPTICDHLVLGLRKKDVIATFNWDPFFGSSRSTKPDSCEAGTTDAFFARQCDGWFL
jgi:hypothetical protein